MGQGETVEMAEMAKMAIFHIQNSTLIQTTEYNNLMLE